MCIVSNWLVLMTICHAARTIVLPSFYLGKNTEDPHFGVAVAGYYTILLWKIPLAGRISWFYTGKIQWFYNSMLGKSSSVRANVLGQVGKRHIYIEYICTLSNLQNYSEKHIAGSKIFRKTAKLLLFQRERYSSVPVWCWNGLVL